MSKRILIIASIAIGLILIGLWWYLFVFTRVVTVDLNNVASVSVREDQGNEVAQVSPDDSSVRLPSGRDYQLVYVAATNYADGSVELSRDQSTISISPDYSTQYYQSLITENLPAVTKLLRNKYQNFSKYAIHDQRMYERGDWLALVLRHQGDYDVYTDDLRVIFKRDGDTWSMATEPDILLDKYDNPDVPYDILLKVNQI